MWSGVNFGKLSHHSLPPPHLNTKYVDMHSGLCLATRALYAIVSVLELILRIIGNHSIGYRMLFSFVSF